MLEKVAEIVSDKKSGSSQISLRLLNHLAEAPINEDPQRTPQLLDELYEAVLKRRSLISPINLVSILRESYSLALAETGGRLSFKEMARRLSKLYVAALNDALRVAERRLTGCRAVLTLSKSSQVLSLMKRLSELEVRVLAGWPLMDGLAAYKEMRASGVKASLIPDLSICEAIEEVDILLMGCDAVLLDGSAVNRAGSKAAALAARDAGVSTLVLCDSTKLDLNSIWAPEKWSLTAEEAAVEFQVFEKVGSSLVTEYISELGCFPPASFVDAARREVSLSWPRRVARQE